MVLILAVLEMMALHRDWMQPEWRRAVATEATVGCGNELDDPALGLDGILMAVDSFGPNRLVAHQDLMAGLGLMTTEGLGPCGWLRGQI